MVVFNCFGHMSAEDYNIEKTGYQPVRGILV